MSSINFQRVYQLGEDYESIKEQALLKLSKYYDYPNLFTFNDQEKSVTYTTERLIPTVYNNRPRVMLLFSNPHPHSIYQGMFLSPNTIGRESLFWPTMNKAGCLSFKDKPENPKKMASLYLETDYQGPFDLIFYCYYAFPTDYPKDIRTIFGNNYFTKTIEAEAKDEFIETAQDTAVDAIVTFNKGVFNLVSELQIERYIKRLNAGETIRSNINGIDRGIPIFLTYPTGWRYHKEYMQLRVSSLEKIKSVISNMIVKP